MQYNTQINTPYFNTTAQNNPELFFEELLENFQRKINVCIPCKIIRYDRVKHEADMKVLCNWKLQNGNVVEGCHLYRITIQRMMAGGMLIEFPIECGDTGWLFSCDFDAYDVKRERSARLPSSEEPNSFKSGVWIPDQFGDPNRASNTDLKGTKIADEDRTRLVIQNKDGTHKVSIGDNSTKISGNSVEIEAKSVRVKADSIVFDGAVKVRGAATGLITETTVAQVQNGIIVGIN